MILKKLKQKLTITNLAHILFISTLVLFPTMIVISHPTQPTPIRFTLTAKDIYQPVEYDKIIAEYQVKVGMPNYSKQQIEYIDYAYKYSEFDKNFVYMLFAENGKISPDRQSDYWENGVREPSWGFCQIHIEHHPEYYSNPKFWENKIFTDWKYQIRECHKMFVGGTKFYGFKRFQKDWKFRNKIKSQVQFN